MGMCSAWSPPVSCAMDTEIPLTTPGAELCGRVLREVACGVESDAESEVSATMYEMVLPSPLESTYSRPPTMRMRAFSTCTHIHSCSQLDSNTDDHPAAAETHHE